jgi:SAM-dependent methyltransferase
MRGGNDWPAQRGSMRLQDMTSSDLWDIETAERYDETSAFMFRPEVLDPAVDFLADLAGGGAALELAIGTGRVAIPLTDRGVAVSGIELSQPMVDQLHRKRPEIPVVVGDMTTSVVPGGFSLVYLVWNSLGNLRTQAEQVACFHNAARHLRPGGRFVIELGIPGIRRFPPGQSAVPFHVGGHHVGFDTYDMATQQGTSHHYTRHDDGSVTYVASNFRYAWPAECDLMAQLAGLELERRVADWDAEPFTGDSESHVSVWRNPGPGETPTRPALADVGRLDR